MTSRSTLSTLSTWSTLSTLSTWPTWSIWSIWPTLSIWSPVLQIKWAPHQRHQRQSQWWRRREARTGQGQQCGDASFGEREMVQRLAQSWLFWKIGLLLLCKPTLGLYEDGGAGRLETKCVFPVLNTQPSNICSFRNYTNTQYCFKTQVSYLPFSTVHCGKYPLYCIHKYPLYCIFLLPGSFALCWQGFALRDALIWRKT